MHMLIVKRENFFKISELQGRCAYRWLLNWPPLKYLRDYTKLSTGSQTRYSSNTYENEQIRQIFGDNYDKK